MDPAQIPIRASTQKHLDIEDIKDNIIILKTGSCSIILQTNAVNFDLLSEAEQDATIYAYAGLINSLSFPIQIFIRSHQKDISSYLNLLKKQKNKQSNKKIQEQITKYQKFIEKTVKENRVLDKKFFVVIPFSTFELGVSQTIKKSLSGRSSHLPFSKTYILQRAKTNLFPKRDHIIKQFHRLGLKIKQLNTQQLIELLHEIYNPGSKGQLIGTDEEYSPHLVEPNIINNEKNISNLKQSPEEIKTKDTNTNIEKTNIDQAVNINPANTTNNTQANKIQDEA
ncbi:hypothetical protein ACFLZ1_00480 [Patescibacteria group bacterium]